MEKSRDYIWDDRAPAYAKSGDLAAGMATEHFGLSIDSVTRQRWQQLMSVMREVDTWADEGAVTSDEVLQGLVDYSAFERLYPALGPEELAPETGAALLQRTARVLRLGGYAARTASIERFVALRVAEARESVDLFADVATNAVRVQPAFMAEFMPTLRALGEAATLWDSAIDGKQDWRSGKQQLQPSFDYYRQLTSAMVARGKLGGAALVHVGPLVSLGIKGGLRVMNRLRHGVPEYSNLRLFMRRK